MFIYGNWSAYDELSDSIPLDEKLAMDQFEHLLRLRRHGVRFDAYLMDAFWYDPSGAYRTWKKSTWPDGPDRWLDACREHGLLPGLWFTANTLFHMELPNAWADSIDAGNWGLCLFEGGFLSDFVEVLSYWYEKGVRIFKLDFAEFNAVPSARTNEIPAEAAREKNVSAYRAALSAFKKAHPEAVFMGFNGFDDAECMNRSDNPPGQYIDLAWLTVLDSIYCGDPRPSDIPSDFWHSVDVYSDCMTRVFESSGIPLSRIDNCGFMAGPTGTCYWRGKAGWRQMLELSYARGGKFHVAYGDLSQFTDEDAEWWAQTQCRFIPFLEDGETVAIGGWPGAGERYGWRNALADEILETWIDPGFEVDGAEIGKAYAEGQSVSIEIPKQAGRFRVVLTQRSEDGRAIRTNPQPNVVFPFEFEIEDAQGKRKLPPMFDRPIWSGMSWGAQEFDSEGLVSVIGSTVEANPRRLELRLTLLQST